MGNTNTTDHELVDHFRAMLGRAFVAHQVDGAKARHAVYASAREALSRHLKSQPGSSDSVVADEIAHHLTALELAISQIEDEFNKSARNSEGSLAKGSSRSSNPAVEDKREAITYASDQAATPSSTSPPPRPSHQAEPEATGESHQHATAGSHDAASDEADDGASGIDQPQKPEALRADSRAPGMQSGVASENSPDKSGITEPVRDEGTKNKMQHKKAVQKATRDTPHEEEIHQVASKAEDEKAQKKIGNVSTASEHVICKNRVPGHEKKSESKKNEQNTDKNLNNYLKASNANENEFNGNPESKRDSQEKSESNDPEQGNSLTEGEASLFDGVPEISDEMPSAPPHGAASPYYRLSKGTFLLLGAALVAMTFSILLFGNPRYWWLDSRLAQTDVLSDIIMERDIQAFLDTKEFEDMPAPVVRMGELSERREITGSLSQQGEGDDVQTVVRFDDLALSLVFDVRRDSAPQRETRDIIHVEIGQTPEPIFSFGSPMLVFPNVSGITGIDSVTVRLGMRRLAIGFMEPILPILNAKDVAFAVIEFPVRFESGERIEISVPFERSLFVDPSASPDKIDQ